MMLRTPSKTSSVLTNSSKLTNMSLTSRPLGFLSLPPNIRIEIYRYVLLHDIGGWVELPLSTENSFSPPTFPRIEDHNNNENVRSWLQIPGCADRSERPIPTPSSCQIGLLLTSSKIYWEVMPILYQERNFHFQLGSGYESLRMLINPTHDAGLYNAMNSINISIFWESARSKHINKFFKIFALPISRWVFRIRVIVLKSWTKVEVEQWLIDAIAGLKAFENVFFCMRFRLVGHDHENGHYSLIEEGVKHALGPAVWSSWGLHFRPKNYEDVRVRALSETGEKVRFRRKRDVAMAHWR